MGRYDKYDPKAGGFRAPLAADFAVGNIKTVFGVGLDANGRVVMGAGNSGIVGVLVLTQAKSAGDIVDVMTNGEITDAALVAGTAYYAATADGVLGTTAPAAGDNAVRVGHTVEADRLVIRVQEVQG